MEKLFKSNGFWVDMIIHKGVAKSLGKDLASIDYENILFVAEHLRFSDDQVNILSCNYIVL